MGFRRDFECPTGWCDCDSCKDRKGEEEDGTVICGRRPKQFKCPNCGCQNFTLAQRTLMEVDFSREGAIEGHPFLGTRSRVEGEFDFVCFDCCETVPDEQAKEMLKEVI